MAGSFKNDILPMFRQMDIDCMSDYGVKLDHYEWMSKPKNAENVYARLSGERLPQMPEDGEFWTEEMLKKFSDWMNVDPKFQP